MLYFFIRCFLCVYILVSHGVLGDAVNTDSVALFRCPLQNHAESFICYSLNFSPEVSIKLIFRSISGYFCSSTFFHVSFIPCRKVLQISKAFLSHLEDFDTTVGSGQFRFFFKIQNRNNHLELA